MDSLGLRLSEVSVETLAAHLTIDDEGLKFGQFVSEEVKLMSVQRQRAVIQQRPVDDQINILSKFSAQYLPRLLDAWKANEGALNSHACMLNLIGSSGVLCFARFMRQAEARGIVALQVKRMASNEFPGSYGLDDLGEIGQFLSTVLMFQGDADVEQQHRAAVLPKLKQLRKQYNKYFAGETLGRCCEYLSGDSISIMMHNEVKERVEADLHICGANGCKVTTGERGTNMMQCSRCKVARYCSPKHQKEAWSSHKAICFPANF